MPRGMPFFGALVPTLLFVFVGSAVVFVLADRVLGWLGLYRLVWHPPLFRLALFTCLFGVAGLVTFDLAG